MIIETLILLKHTKSYFIILFIIKLTDLKIVVFEKFTKNKVIHKDY